MPRCRASALTTCMLVTPLSSALCMDSLILFAATDTTSNSTARTLERLAQNEGVQARLRQELVEAQREGHMSYDELMRLPLLDATVRETLRT